MKLFLIHFLVVIFILLTFFTTTIRSISSSSSLSSSTTTLVSSIFGISNNIKNNYKNNIKNSYDNSRFGSGFHFGLNYDSKVKGTTRLLKNKNNNNYNLYSKAIIQSIHGGGGGTGRTGGGKGRRKKGDESNNSNNNSIKEQEKKKQQEQLLHSIGTTTTIPFHKYQGLGNDFILIDNRHQKEPILTMKQAARLCHRHFGIGGDGVIFVLPGENGMDYTMRIYNSDGSEPEMCGNGIRCMAKFLVKLENKEQDLYDNNSCQDDNNEKEITYTIHTLAGPIIPKIKRNGLVTVDMGSPILEGKTIPTTLSPTMELETTTTTTKEKKIMKKENVVVNTPLMVQGKLYNVTCISMGNPHAIVFVNNLDDIHLEKIGPMFENHSVFPARTNTEFVQVMNSKHVKMKVWERGAGATLACGTGTCALVVAGVLTGKNERSCLVTLPGGDLHILWNEKNNKIYMTGPADLVFSGFLKV